MIRGRLILACGLAIVGLVLFAWHWMLGDSFAGLASLLGCALAGEIVRPSHEDVIAAHRAQEDKPASP